MSIILVLDEVRSSYNVGSLLRSADGFGIGSVISIGITPHMRRPKDTRLPHVIAKAEKQISKTALNAERLMDQHFDTKTDFIIWSKFSKYPILALELDNRAIDIKQFKVPTETVLLVVGNEINGVSEEIINASSAIIEIPMQGQKESFNVAVSGAIAMYELTKDN